MPLRERLEDVPLLVHAFLRQFRSVLRNPVLQVSPEALQIPARTEECRRISHAPEASPSSGGPSAGDSRFGVKNELWGAQRQAERVRMLGALQETGENCSEAERLLGMSRRTFYRRLSEDDAPATRDWANSARP